ncbi:MAG: flagellar motor switch protein FliG [Rhodothermaceae bacterium]|nr:flagellar motor switch protein FliG [Rhodothermaceae bacterium]
MSETATLQAPAVPKAPAPPKASSVPTRGVQSSADLTGSQRAAAFLILLGVETASKVLALLPSEYLERVSVEIARLRNVPSEIVDELLFDFHDMALARDHVAQGGISYAREVLESTLGANRAEDVMMRVEAAVEVSAFHLLQTVEISQLTRFIEREHPQTAALILAHLNPRKAGEIIATLSEPQQGEVVYRLATMGQTSPELLHDIEAVIRHQIGSVFAAGERATGGVAQVAQILNGTPRAAERTVMDALRERDPELANAITGLMFVFDDLVHISGRDLQRLLVEIEQKNLVLALKGASDAFKEKVLENVSERVAQTIKEELDLLGPVRIADVEEAQQSILERARELEETEEISLDTDAHDQLL